MAPVIDQPLNSQPVFLKGGEGALLFLHGFTSTPQSLMPVAELLHQAGWTVSLPLLPGHGRLPQDMISCTGQTWLDFALAEYDQLVQTYPRLAVAGLSMGAAMALHVAARRPVPAVVALAPALYLRDWRLALLPIIKYLMPWKSAIGSDIKKAGTIEITYRRFPTRSLESLLAVMRIVSGELAEVKVPLLTMQSQYDHTIPPSCMDDLLKWAGSRIKESYRFTNSYHVITQDNDYPEVARRMIEFLGRFVK